MATTARHDVTSWSRGVGRFNFFYFFFAPARFRSVCAIFLKIALRISRTQGHAAVILSAAVTYFQ